MKHFIIWVVGTFIGVIFYHAVLKPIARKLWQRYSYTRTKKLR